MTGFELGKLPPIGRYSGVPDDIYHSWIQALGSSGCRTIVNKSLAKYYWDIDNPKEPTDNLVFGRTVHSGILEPKLFALKFACAPECDRRTTVGKKIYADFVYDSAGKTVLSKELYDQAVAMAEGFSAHPKAGLWLMDGEAEVVYIAVDSATQIHIKARPDYITPFIFNEEYDRYETTIYDLKTTVDASLEGFAKAIANYGYHIQAAFYIHVVEQYCMAVFHKRLLVKSFNFIALEKTEPYEHHIAIYDLHSDDIEAGRVKVGEALKKLSDYRLAKAMKKEIIGYGYPVDKQLIQRPYWARKEDLK